MRFPRKDQANRSIPTLLQVHEACFTIHRILRVALPTLSPSSSLPLFLPSKLFLGFSLSYFELRVLTPS